MGIMTVLLGHSKQNNEILREKFLAAINLKGEYGKGAYSCIEYKAMVGCLIIGFCRQDLVPRIKNI